MNLWERNELVISIMLIYLRDTGHDFIKEVGLKGYNYDKLPINFYPENLLYMSDLELAKFAEGLGIVKTPSRSKSDVYINGEGYSFQSYKSTTPVIVNHTTRVGFEVACNYCHVDIKILDSIISDYWDLRIKGLINGEVKNVNSLSPFYNYFNTMAPIIEYFIFDGYSTGLSDHPANYILDFSNPLNPKQWAILNRRETVTILWDRLVFSMRSKGMPTKYPNLSDMNKQKSIEIWTRYFDDQYVGALNIRVK